jgi:hypothetical protein
MENLTLDVLDPGMLPYYRQPGNYDMVNTDAHR